MEVQNTPTRLSQFLNNPRVPLIVLAAMGGLLLIYFAGGRLLAYLPYGLFLLCPLMHLFMHRGHGGHSGHESHGGHGCCPSHAADEENPERRNNG